MGPPIDVDPSVEVRDTLHKSKSQHLRVRIQDPLRIGRNRCHVAQADNWTWHIIPSVPAPARRFPGDQLCGG
jgi:hypothetical protein